MLDFGTMFAFVLVMAGIVIIPAFISWTYVSHSIKTMIALQLFFIVIGLIVLSIFL